MDDTAMTRPGLGACLAAADRDAVLSAARHLTEGWSVTPLQPAEAGLALMQWRDAVMHQPFFLGEVPMARAAVTLADRDGRRCEGGAVLMADDAERAQAQAVLDALWAARWPGADTVARLAAQGAQRRARERAQRRAMLLRTRVNFSLLAETGEDDA